MIWSTEIAVTSTLQCKAVMMYIVKIWNIVYMEQQIFLPRCRRFVSADTKQSYRIK